MYQWLTETYSLLFGGSQSYLFWLWMLLDWFSVWWNENYFSKLNDVYYRYVKVYLCNRNNVLLFPPDFNIFSWKERNVRQSMKNYIFSYRRNETEKSVKLSAAKTTRRDVERIEEYGRTRWCNIFYCNSQLENVKLKEKKYREKKIAVTQKENKKVSKNIPLSDSRSFF